MKTFFFNRLTLSFKTVVWERSRREKTTGDFLKYFNQNLPGKLGQQSTTYLFGLFRDYGLNFISFRNKTFFVFQDRKLTNVDSQ